MLMHPGVGWFERTRKGKLVVYVTWKIHEKLAVRWADLPTAKGRELLHTLLGQELADLVTTGIAQGDYPMMCPLTEENLLQKARAREARP